VTIQGSVKNIPPGAFSALFTLESVRIEEGVTTIGGSAFYGCISLSNLTLPNSLTHIEQYAFLQSLALTSVTIPRNVTHIGSAAFRAEHQGSNARAITIRGYAGSAAQTYANTEGSRWRTTFEAITGNLPDVLPGGATPTTPPSGGGVSVLFNGSPMSFEVPPQIINARTMVPLRAIFEAMGASIEWEGSTQTVTATKDDTVVVLKIGDTSPTVNGRVVPIDQPGVLVNSRTLAPLRFVAEAFGGTVEWDQATQTASITL